MKTCFQFIALGLIISMVSPAIAQNDAKDAKSDAKAADTKAADTKQQTAKEVEDALRAKLQAKPDNKPTTKPVDDTATPKSNSNDTNQKTDPKPEPVNPPAVTSVGRTDTPDPRIIGIAPGQRKPKLRREGEFLINRRGRLVSSGDVNQKMFVFDGDSAAAPEPPMFLLPCRLLENMESLTKDRGDRMVFQLSGQVFVYRGANYMLPTMMRPAIDKGNLRN